jgi:hypothetical protein
MRTGVWIFVNGVLRSRDVRKEKEAVVVGVVHANGVTVCQQGELRDRDAENPVVLPNRKDLENLAEGVVATPHVLGVPVRDSDLLRLRRCREPLHPWRLEPAHTNLRR